PMKSSSVSSDFTSKLLNLDNTHPRLEETSSQTSSLFTVPVTTIPKITSAITIPPPTLICNPLYQETTPTPIPITSTTTTSTTTLPNFASVFKFNERVANLEKDLSEMKQFDQYAKALSSILAIMDRYINNKLGEAIQKAIHAHNLDSAAALSKFELTKILIDKMEKNKSYDIADYKMELYDALIISYNSNKDMFESYGNVISLKRSRDDKDKDQVPYDGLNRGTKRRKSIKEAEPSREPKSKESKSSSTSKGTSYSQHKPSGKSAHAEQPSHNAKELDPPTSFDELNYTAFYFFAFSLNRLNIPNLTQAILVGPAYNLLQGTCKRQTELEYHFEECFKATNERLDRHNKEGQQYPFDILKDYFKLFLRITSSTTT
ncbi:hypothetical protein Tco_1266048, partial [Tanacetum coccineum]